MVMGAAGSKLEMSSAMEVEEIKISDSTSTAWTDEKHSLYLNSMEASFVNQLYSRDYLSKDFLGWYSSKGKHSNSSGSSANSLLPHEFKVQRGGCWTKVKFERAKRRANIENQSHPLSANPWIQHFRSSFGKDPDIIGSKTEKELIIAASNQVDDNVRAIQSIHIASPGHRREATNSTQLSANHSHLCCQDSLGCNTEFSDQNFVGKEVERVEQSSRSYCKKRSRISDNDPTIKDQVVPSGKLLLQPSSSECQSRLIEEVAESSRKPDGINCRTEYSSRNPAVEQEATFFKDHDLDSE